jgi:phage terminase large subunit
MSETQVEESNPALVQARMNITLPDGTPHIMYEPTSEKHLWFHLCKTKNLLAYGNRGGGKSHLLRFDAHMRALSVPEARLILVRKTYPELMKSHLQFIEREMAMLGGDYHKTEHIAYYPNGSKLFFSHVSTEKDSLNLLSAEFIAAYFDELSTIDWDFFVKLGASVRIGGNLKTLGVKGVIRAATNPLGPSAHDVFAYFVNKDVDPDDDPDYNPNDWDAIKIQMADNQHIDTEDYLKQFSGMPGYLKKAWLDGDFALENQLFDFKRTKNDKPWHVINEVPLIGKHPILSYEF